ncbi:putative naringenin-chalcone synthase [Hymenobacter luteus]|uniref:Naringenin-chalcone synthase n=2 Tax=Hymenobacter TaxID=89966 RepID=A0ABR6JSP2_9BACT|nr:MULTISPECIES: type III polyketide synthase [Hymenobacter]MBB4599735.1 putative naringenin-chalcone synthase [Hymenobacter latericoloratus]MBB6057955.1 putative naringenin-chalcone synthase [Hymenobacter luteus]
MSSYLCAIGTANPPHRIPQLQIADFMAGALQLDEGGTRKLRALYRVSGIGQRYTVLPDYGRANGRFEFFPNTPDLEPFPSVGQRMAEYRRHALPLSVQAAQDCLRQVPETTAASITHLITVSCTGMYAPGLDIELVAALGLPGHVQRTCVNFMGCYAAVNALKLADAFCRATPAARVLVVCTELCTLHFQKSTEEDHLVSNALFGDGSAAVLVQGRPRAAGPSLALTAFHCGLEPDGHADMAWHINNFGFEMTLSSYVPRMIQQGIGQLTARLLADLPVQLADIRAFAIHPGGRKILESIEQALGLTAHDNRFAYQVLRDYGNMSSATVLFVLRELLRTLAPADAGAPVLSFAFGPGLTLEAMLLTVAWGSEPSARKHILEHHAQAAEILPA